MIWRKETGVIPTAAIHLKNLIPPNTYPPTSLGVKPTPEGHLLQKFLHRSRLMKMVWCLYPELTKGQETDGFSGIDYYNIQQPQLRLPVMQEAVTQQ